MILAVISIVMAGVLALTAAGCDSGAETRAQLTGVNIYVYSTEHNKPQPMLINVLSEAAELQTFNTRIDEAADADTAALASIEGMRMYRFQLEFKAGKDGQSMYRDYIYVTDHAGTGYLKAIPYSAAYDFDALTDEDMKQLLDRIGHSDWLVMTAPILEPILG